MKINVGVEIGAQFIQVGLVDKYGRLVARNKSTSHSDLSLKEIVAEAANLITELLDHEGYEIKGIKSIGIGCPGVVDQEAGKVVKTYVMGFYNAPIKEEFKAYFHHAPIYVENDAHCAALAESVNGAAEDMDYSLTINLGAGISGGIIINNKIYTGYKGSGAVLGHMVIDKHGKKCSCGRTGCFETVCSAKALIEATRELAIKNPESEVMKICKGDLDLITETTVYEAMKHGDMEAKAIFDTYVENLAIALTNYANLLMPEVIILCGGVTALGEDLLNPIRAHMQENVFSREVVLPVLEISQMGSAAVIIGAGMLGTTRG